MGFPALYEGVKYESCHDRACSRGVCKLENIPGCDRTKEQSQWTSYLALLVNLIKKHSVDQ